MTRSTPFFAVTGPIRSRGRFLSAATDILSGSTVAIMASTGLWYLWLEAQTLLPFAVPQDFLHYLNQHAPSILSKLVAVIGSLAGLLVGISWFFAGLGETGLGPRRRVLAPGALLDPAHAANCMVPDSRETSENPRTASLGLGLFREALGRLTPSTGSIVKQLCVSALKWAVLFLLLLGIHRILGLFTSFTRKHFEIDFTIPTSEVYSLFFLVSGLILADLVLASTLFLRRPASHAVDHIRIQANTKARPGFLLALFEESIRVWASTVSLGTELWRIAHRDAGGHRGTLLETRPSMPVAPLWKTGCACMIGSIVFTLVGFYWLIHFNLIDGHAGSSESLGSFALPFAFRVLLLITLLIAGRHFAKWTRRFSNVTEWRSNLFLVTVSSYGMHSQDDEPERGKEELTRSESHWTLADFQDVGVKAPWDAPGEPTSITVDVCWGEAVTESAYEHSGRSLLTIKPSALSLELIETIVEAPFEAHFYKDVRRDKDPGFLRTGGQRPNHSH